MMDDDWVKAASSDGSLVAELLIRILHSPPPSPPPPPPPPAILPLKWSVRQPRTRSRARAHKTGATRGSPTTPLYWTGGSTSLSGGAAAAPAAVDGSEESSRPGAGSKLTATNEATLSKRSTRKKKTMTELKEAEISMLTDNKELKRTLASILINLEKKQSENTNLKRIKLDLASQKPNTDRAVKRMTISEPCAALPVLSSLPNRCPEAHTEVEGDFDKFAIPDLNVAFVESNNGGPSDE